MQAAAEAAAEEMFGAMDDNGDERVDAQDAIGAMKSQQSLTNIESPWMMLSGPSVAGNSVAATPPSIATHFDLQLDIQHPARRPLPPMSSTGPSVQSGTAQSCEAIHLAVIHLVAMDNLLLLLLHLHQPEHLHGGHQELDNLEDIRHPAGGAEIQARHGFFKGRSAIPVRHMKRKATDCSKTGLRDSFPVADGLLLRGGRTYDPKNHPQYKVRVNEVFLSELCWVPDSCHSEAGGSSCEIFEKVHVIGVLLVFQDFV